MKKLLFVLLVFCSAQLAAQTKESLQKKLTKSDTEINDPKKGLDSKTWINRANLLINIYEYPVKDVMPGMSQVQVKTILKKERTRTDNVEISGVPYEVLLYSDKKLYFDEKGMLVFFEIIDEITAAPLMQSYDSYERAYQLDEKKSNSKKIREGLKNLKLKMNTEATAAYNLEKYNESLQFFEGSLKCSDHPLVAETDSLVIYNTAFIARIAGDNEKALKYYKKAMDIGYDYEGEVYARYAELIRPANQEESDNILRKGLLKYPENQEILILLINTSLEEGNDLSTVLPYIKQAQENEPNNPSVFYVEGTIYEKMNNVDKALECYKKAIEINPNYFPAHYNVGAVYYNKAVEIQNEASGELDDNKYEQLMKDMEVEFEKAIPYLTKANELMPEERSVVESLRSIYYRFHEKNPEMQEKYDFYVKLLETM